MKMASINQCPRLAPGSGDHDFPFGCPRHLLSLTPTWTSTLFDFNTLSLSELSNKVTVGIADSAATPASAPCIGPSLAAHSTEYGGVQGLVLHDDQSMASIIPNLTDQTIILNFLNRCAQSASTWPSPPFAFWLGLQNLWRKRQTGDPVFSNGCATKHLGALAEVEEE